MPIRYVLKKKPNAPNPMVEVKAMEMFKVASQGCGSWRGLMEIDREEWRRVAEWHIAELAEAVRAATEGREVLVG